MYHEQPISVVQSAVPADRSSEASDGGVPWPASGLALVRRFADIYTRECLLGFIFDTTRGTPTHEREKETRRRGDGGGCKRKLRTARTGQARARGTAGGTRSDARRATHLRTARTGQARARGTAGGARSDARRRYKTRAKQTRNRRICAMTGIHRGTASCSHAPNTEVAIGPRHIHTHTQAKPV